MLFMISIPLATLVYAVALAVFGLPLLWLWPGAFRRGAFRGRVAAATGAVVVLVVGGRGGFDPFHLGQFATLLTLMMCGSLAGFVWWYLNFDAAPD